MSPFPLFLVSDCAHIQYFSFFQFQQDFLLSSILAAVILAPASQDVSSLLLCIILFVCPVSCLIRYCCICPILRHVVGSVSVRDFLSEVGNQPCFRILLLHPDLGLTGTIFNISGGIKIMNKLLKISYP